MQGRKALRQLIQEIIDDAINDTVKKAGEILIKDLYIFDEAGSETSPTSPSEAKPLAVLESSSPAGRTLGSNTVGPDGAINSNIAAPAPWAVATGEDDYGRWADIEVLSSTTRDNNPVCFRMRWIPPGSFLMGSPASEAGRDDNEGPQHKVTLTEGYWLADTPCTQEVWKAVMNHNPSNFKSATRPVENVTWKDLERFLRRLKERLPKLKPALPTEAQGSTLAARARSQARTQESLRFLTITTDLF